MPADATRLVCRASLALACLLGLAAPAQAFVVYETSGGTALHWPPDARPVATLDPTFSEPFAPGAAEQLVARASARWTRSDCTRLEVQVVDGPACSGEDDDGINCLYTVSDSARWHAVSGPAQWESGSNQVALTLVHFDSRRGTIFDVDMAFNAAYFEFSAERACDPNAADLDAVVTHEFGHFFGLDHSLAPDATMAPTSGPGDCDKRDLTADDEAGLCSIYLDLDDSSGCAGGSGGALPSAWLAALLIGGLAARRSTIRRTDP